MAEDRRDTTTKQVVSKRRKVKAKKKPRKLLLKISIAFLFLIGIAWLSIGVQLVKYHKQAQELVANASEKTFKASQTSIVYDTNGKQMFKLKGEKDVYYLKYSKLPVYAVAAMISVEDQDFYKHSGISVRGIGRALVSYVTNKGEITQGGSTITQQLAKGVFLTNERSWKRKAKEIFIALELEKIYSKDQIMEFYLNNIYFANGYYGIQAASQGYFGKDAEDLSLAQATFLCSIPNAPSMYEPYKNKDNTVVRQKKILKDMLEQKMITKSQYKEALNEKIKLKAKKKDSTEKRNYIESYVIYTATRALMKNQGFVFKEKFSSDEAKKSYQEEYSKLYAKCKTQLYSSGYRIYTSIDLKVQEKLQDSINNAMDSYDSKDKNGIYKAQAAGTCIDNETGKVAAIVGGRYQKKVSYSLNRAFQSPRQPGSAIKPLLVFGPAMERGYGPGSIVSDSPMKSNDKHRVNNSGGSYSGNITIRKALQKSSNVVTMRLYEELGPTTALRYLERMNFKSLTSVDYKYYTTCLGGFTYGTTAEEMAAGYATFPNNGVYREPTCIDKIDNSDGDAVVEDSDISSEKTIFSKTTSSMMSSCLQSVVKSGTGVGAKVPNVDTAGKTGTTTSNKDGWFCGYTPYYTTAIWVGRDDNKTMAALSGASYPKSIWSSFMNKIHSEISAAASPSSGSSYSYNDYGSGSSGGSSGGTSSGNTSGTSQATTAQATTSAPTTSAPTTSAPATSAPATDAQQ
ncbi:MAG: PBP1A family penicillin-binding protein [Anaerostipes sp.]|nr:PBP1A family penicillin-binding protein [Anaerostipes sp.]